MLFVVEVGGRAIIAFPAETRAAAQAEMDDRDSIFHEGLHLVCNPDRTPLWDGKSELHVREAEPEEQALWDRGVARAIQDGEIEDRDEALSDQYLVYLVSVLEIE